MTQELILLNLVVSIGAAALCAWFADRKGRNVWKWAALGFLLGVLPLIYLATRRSNRGTSAPPK